MLPLTFLSVLVWNVDYMILIKRWTSQTFCCKAKVMPRLHLTPLAFLVFLAGGPQVMHFPIFQFGATQFPPSTAGFPYLFPFALQGKCSGPFHCSVLFFITDEIREKKYQIWSNCKDYSESWKILLKSFHCSAVPSGVTSGNLWISPSTFIS